MQDNPRTYFCELNVLRYANEIAIFSVFVLCRLSDKEVIIVFHDVRPSLRGSNTLCVGPIPGFFHRYYDRAVPVLVSLIMSLCFEHLIFFVFGNAFITEE